MTSVELLDTMHVRFGAPFTTDLKVTFPPPGGGKRRDWPPRRPLPVLAGREASGEPALRPRPPTPRAARPPAHLGRQRLALVDFSCGSTAARSRSSCGRRRHCATLRSP